MALIRCPDCGKEISDKAPACIHCGRPAGASPDQVPPEQHPPKRSQPQTVLAISGAVALAAGLACLPVGKVSWALGFLAVGLGCVLSGSAWAWLNRE